MRTAGVALIINKKIKGEKTTYTTREGEESKS
jgi:hypothetical protein